MPRHLISDAHEWINEIPTVPIYYLAKLTEVIAEEEEEAVVVEEGTAEVLVVVTEEETGEVLER